MFDLVFNHKTMEIWVFSPDFQTVLAMTKPENLDLCRCTKVVKTTYEGPLWGLVHFRSPFLVPLAIYGLWFLTNTTSYTTSSIQFYERSVCRWQINFSLSRFLPLLFTEIFEISLGSISLFASLLLETPHFCHLILHFCCLKLLFLFMKLLVWSYVSSSFIMVDKNVVLLLKLQRHQMTKKNPQTMFWGLIKPSKSSWCSLGKSTNLLDDPQSQASSW